MRFLADTTTLKTFERSLQTASREVSDLRVPLAEIGKRFFQSRKFIFKRTGPGQYQDLSEKYKKRKQREYGFLYPILRASGTLENSITNHNDANAISVATPRQLIVGTDVPWGVFHQQNHPGKGIMPRRPFLFWGPESPDYATDKSIQKFNRNIAVILFTYLEKTLNNRLTTGQARTRARARVQGNVFD